MDHHPDVALGLSNLGTLFFNMGQYAKAEPLLQQSLKIREAKLGLDHPDVAQTLNQLANLYSNMGQFAKAEPLYPQLKNPRKRSSASVTPTWRRA